MKKKKFVEYEESLKELKRYILEIKTRPSEKKWNKYAIEKGFLLSGTIGYVSGKGFNLLCRDLIKESKIKEEE